MLTLRPVGAVAGPLVVLAGLAGTAASVTPASADDHAGRGARRRRQGPHRADPDGALRVTR